MTKKVTKMENENFKIPHGGIRTHACLTSYKGYDQRPISSLFEGSLKGCIKYSDFEL